MAVKSLRIHAELDPPVYRAVERLARLTGVSLSRQVCNLVSFALADLEDDVLEAFAEERRRTWKRTQPLSTQEVRRRLKPN